MSRPNQSESSILDKWRQAIFNAQNRPEIVILLKEYGYDIPQLTEGDDLLNVTVLTWKKNAIEGDEATEASAIYSKNLDKLTELYKIDRNKTKTLFRNDPVLLSRLQLAGSFPEPYLKLTNSATKLYEEILGDKDLQAKVAKVKIPLADVTSRMSLINVVKEARSNWQAEKGQSEDATIAKDQAMAKMDDWMDNFYAMAKLALMDHPQYLEALGIVVKR